jgi:hypothetical protein
MQNSIHILGAPHQQRWVAISFPAGLVSKISLANLRRCWQLAISVRLAIEAAYD